jgi:hypothetical protein
MNWAEAGKGAAGGAGMGSMLGPWGTAIGAGVGFFKGLFSKKPKPVAQAAGSGINPGGGSGIDYDAVRARAIAPTRAVYQNAMRNLRRQPGMGINQPGYGAQMTALSRGMSSGISDAATNAEGAIANTRLQELGQAQNYDIAQRQTPSNLSKGLSTTSQVLGLIGKGADIASGMGVPKFGGGASKPWTAA